MIVINIIQPKNPSRTTPIEGPIDILPKLTSVTALYLNCGSEYPSNWNPFNHRLFSTCWSSFGSKLNVLRLTLTVELFARAIDPHLHFPCLEELTIHISCSFRTTDVNALTSSLVVPFIQRHHATLQTLRLEFLEYSTNVSAFLAPLVSLVHLKHLDLACPYSCLHHTSFHGLQQLFKSYHKSIKSLNLRIHRGYLTPSTQEYFSYECWRIPLPQLEVLVLDMIPSSLDKYLFSYISQFSLSLTSLTLPSTLQMLVSEINPLAVTLARLMCLRYFSMRIHSMNPWLLVIFAQNLPRLKILHLQIFHTHVHKDDPDTSFVVSAQSKLSLTSS